MLIAMEHLYDYWIGPPEPERWPEYLQDQPLRGHGLYCFQEGLRLGLLLAADAFLPESGT